MDNEQRKARIAAGLKWAIGIGAAVLIAPVVFLAVKGLIGLGLALLIGAGIMAAAPVISLQLATWKIQGMKAVARANPIEVREKISIDQKAVLQAKADAITSFAAEVRGFEAEIKALAEVYPDDAVQFRDQLTTCVKLLEHQRQQYHEAAKAVQAFDAATQRARARWKVAQSALRMQRLSGAQADLAMEKILAQESLDSVQNAMDKAFAGLETSIMQIDAARQQLPHAPSPALATNVIDMEVVRK